MDEHERLSDMFGILLVFKMKISLLSTTQESNLGSLSPDSPKTGTKTRRPKFQFFEGFEIMIFTFNGPTIF